MQLILDAANIDIERNMSTTEQESQNEKLLTNKVIEHLADDITSGNKENIQKQNNIIPDIGQDNAIDTDKEIQASGDDTLTNNSNVELFNEDTTVTKCVESSKEIVEQEDLKSNSEEVCNDIINATIKNEKTRIVVSEGKLVEVKKKNETETELEELNKTDFLVNNTVVDDIVNVIKPANTELPTKSNNDVKLDEKVNIPETSPESNEENDVNLDTSGISPKSIEENVVKLSIKVNTPDILPKSYEENDTKTDKNINIDEISTESHEGNKIEFNGETDIELVKNVNILEITETNEEKNDNLLNSTDVLEITETNEEKNDNLLNSTDVLEITETNEEKNDNLLNSTDDLEITETNEEKNGNLLKSTDVLEMTETNEEKNDNFLNSTDVLEIKETNEEKNEIFLNSTDVLEITETNEEKNDNLLNSIDVLEISKEVNEDNESELEREVDISELSRELNEEAAMDLDKEVEEAEISSEPNSVNILEVNESISVRESETQENQVPKIDLNINSKKVDETNQKNVPIEIDDEDEKANDVSAESNKKNQITDKKEDELDEERKSTQENNTVKKVLEDSTQPKRICRLSNNLDIFSDDEEDDHPNVELPKENTPTPTEKQCINVDEDDDIMVIDEESSTKTCKTIEINEKVNADSVSDNVAPESKDTSYPNTKLNTCEESKQNTEISEETLPDEKEIKETIETAKQPSKVSIAETNKIAAEKSKEKEKNTKPLLPKNFVKTCKKNLADMTRDDLEEFCILKIVESIVDRSNLGEIKTQLKNLTQTMEECKKKCLMLTKQNKDLQIVLKSVQEEQKSGSDVHITPLKITRSVGMQVMMVADKNIQRKKTVNGSLPIATANSKQAKAQQMQNTRNQKEKAVTNQQIPVPRLVPATPPAAKVNQPTTNNTPMKQASTNTPLPNGLRVQPPTPKVPEKRSRAQAITVDLTDDEPPTKLANVQRAPLPPMRVLTAAPNLIPAPRFSQNINSPRKVYIPISGPQSQNVRPGQTIMLKSLTSLGPRPRAQAPPQMVKSPQTPSPVRYGRSQPNRHPAPLPDAARQMQPPNWKALPTAPDLKLSKVENGIVISWKIDGYTEEIFEEIASYQLFAYQETSSPPNTTLWKKIGDIKALPLPMACTLTQFMAGYKYYFAVRAVDVRSRIGPFSLPGSILLLNKM